MHPRSLMLSLFLLGSCVLGAAERVALVIGNDAYASGGRLPVLKNCVADARLIAATLRQQLGFKVITVENASRAEMEAALGQLEDALHPGDTAVAYFAGHGIEFERENYLLGCNAKLERRSLIGEEAIKAETLTTTLLQSGAAHSFVFLDCCREKPDDSWATRGVRGAGLAEMNIRGDLIVAFAAAPGAAAQDQPLAAGAGGLAGHSPFAQALAKFLPAGQKHTDLLQSVRTEVARLTQGSQRTWDSGSFLEPFYFSQASAPAAVAATMPPAAAPTPAAPAATPAPPPGDDGRIVRSQYLTARFTKLLLLKSGQVEVTFSLTSKPPPNEELYASLVQTDPGHTNMSIPEHMSHVVASLRTDEGDEFKLTGVEGLWFKNANIRDSRPTNIRHEGSGSSNVTFRFSPAGSRAGAGATFTFDTTLTIDAVTPGYSVPNGSGPWPVQFTGLRATVPQRK
ncbi:caspase domain-containing protein [Prosthecobacter sp.]|uniref:caspase domain-containing protein n=1 Tax=Prosthecobacter sp. TaxID=1965333 RepID=UPI003782FD0C